MFVAAQNAQAQSLLLQGGTAWNLFLMTGTMPETMTFFPFQLNNMESVFANAIAGLRLTAVNNAGYGQEMLAFEHAGTFMQLKMHGARTTNGVPGIQCYPQAISTNIVGLDKPYGYVNGLEDNPAFATADTHITTDGWIEYDLGTECSITKAIFGNVSTTTRNATTALIEYFDVNTDEWVAAGSNLAVKTYVAAGIESNFDPVVARRWRIRFLDNTGTVVANTLQYRYLRFLASETPADIKDKSEMDMTWGILVPAAPVAATYTNANATQIPAHIVTVGGPIDAQIAVLNRRRAGINDPISLIHLKLLGGIVQEVGA